MLKEDYVKAGGKENTNLFKVAHKYVGSCRDGIYSLLLHQINNLKK